MAERLDKFGGPESYNHYAVGWAWAMDTPFQWTKQVASHWGGTRNGTIVHWPNGIEGKGELRSQFCHVIDVAPTVLEAAGIPEPTMVNGVTQSPYRGHAAWSTASTRRMPLSATTCSTSRCSATAASTSRAGARSPSTARPGCMGAVKLPAFDDDVWELYDGNTDYSQAHDLSKQHPDKLHELQRLWLIEATKYNVIPLDDRTAERINADIAGRPQLIRGDTQVFYPGMTRLSENSVLNIKNKSFSVTAEVVAPEEPVNGTIIAQGGALGGWSLYTTDGHAKFAYNLLGIQAFTAETSQPVPAGKHQLRAEFAYDGGGYAKGGTVSLYYDGQKVGEGRVGATQPFIFSADEGLDIGRETGTAVAPECDVEGSVFTGQINWVELKVGDDDHSHLIDPEEHLQVLMARQ